MFGIIILCIFTTLFNLSIQAYYTKLIKTSTSSLESIRIRRMHKLTRFIILILFTSILLFYVYKIISGNAYTPKHNYTTVKVILGEICLITGTYATMALPISTLTIKKFRSRHRKFALYLRGFQSDSYKSQMEKAAETQHRAYNAAYQFKKVKPTSKENVNNQPFNERSFARAIMKIMPIYAVGMTKELESPQGIKRIYLEDETWHEDVSFLIKEAQYIFILLNASDSCIWEILESNKLARDKTIYISDDGVAPGKIWIKLGDEMPDSIPMCMKPHTMSYLVNGEYKDIQYQNDINGFSDVLKNILKSS